MTVYRVEDLSKVAINPSGVGRRDACETAWALHTCFGVDKRRGPDSDPRDRGKAMHKFVDGYVRYYAHTNVLNAFEGPAGKRAATEIFEDLHDEEGVDFGEETCQEIVEAARVQLPKLGLEAFTVERLDDKPLIELDLHATIGGVPFQAIVDAVLRHKITGELWVVDWKSTADAIDITATPNYTEHDQQLAIQRMVVEAKGLKVDRSALVQVRTRAPQPPPLTAKTNKVVRSLAKLACSGEQFRDALVANGEDEHDPKALAKIKQLNNCVWVRWLPDITNAEGQAALVAELIGKGESMLQVARGERMPQRNIHNVTGHQPYRSGCSRCDYGKWCRAELRNGGKPDLTLVGVDYIRNDKATFEPVEGITPGRPGDAYVAYATAYGKPRAEHEVFTP